MIILGKIFGIQGVLFAGPFADGLAFILATIFLIREIRNLKQGNVKVTNKETTTNTESKLSKHVVITIAREYASGGRYIGKLVADKLGIKLYDNEFISKVAKETAYLKNISKTMNKKRDALASLNNGYYSGLNNSDELFIKESE